MNRTLKGLIEIQNVLKENGYPIYADLVSNYVIKYKGREKRVIGFVGDDLVGKSTIINLFLDRNILPTSVIPTVAEISINYGEEERVFLKSGEEAGFNNITELGEEESFLNIVISDEFLREHLLEIKEFHGLLGKQKISDMTVMSEVYKCDVVVLVMTAEHLLSESECAFIENYIQYVGVNHILLVVNKLSAISNNDVENVLKYVEKQFDRKFPKVRWTVFDRDKKNQKFASKFNNKNIKEEVLLLCGKADELDCISVDNMLHYVCSCLEEDIKRIEKEQEKSEEDIKRKNEKLKEQKEWDEASIEETLIEFQKKRNETVKRIDTFIKNKFEEIFRDIIKKSSKAPNKYSWYENELNVYWKKRISDISNKIDEYAEEEVAKDIQWLNALLQTELRINFVTADMPDENLKYDDKITPYGTYKKYAPIGISGGIVIGYCFFRIVGAVVGLSGGLLIYKYLGVMEHSQDDEIQRSIDLKVRDVADEVRKLLRKDIEKSYDEAILEFKRVSKDIIDSKYRYIDINKSEYSEKVEKLSAIVKMIKEV